MNFPTYVEVDSRALTRPLVIIIGILLSHEVFKFQYFMLKFDDQKNPFDV